MSRPVKITSPMVRKNVFIPDRLTNAMSYIAEREDCNESELVRGAISMWLDAYRRASQSVRLEMLKKARETIQ
jgi:hypothetical protein